MSGLSARRWLAIGALALIAACSARKPVPQADYRPAAAPIYSIAAFDPARLPGDWAEVAAFAPEGARCRPGGLRIARSGEGVSVSGRLCRGGVEVAQAGSLRPAGPGRLALTGEAEPWWVIWVDADYRTLVIGTPSGRFGYVLNRGGALPADRMTAARRILDWNGYDLTRLRQLR